MVTKKSTRVGHKLRSHSHGKYINAIKGGSIFTTIQKYALPALESLVKSDAAKQAAHSLIDAGINHARSKFDTKPDHIKERKPKSSKVDPRKILESHFRKGLKY